MKRIAVVSLILPCLAAANRCMKELDWDFDFYAYSFPLQMELPHPGFGQPASLAIFDDTNYENWMHSNYVVEACLRKGDLLWRGRSANEAAMPWGACLPKTCHKAKDAKAACNKLLVFFHKQMEDVYRYDFCGDDYKNCARNLTRMSAWSQLDLDVSIIGFERAGTTVLQQYLYFASDLFTVPGVNNLALDADPSNVYSLGFGRGDDAAKEIDGGCADGVCSVHGEDRNAYSEKKKEIVVQEDTFFEIEIGLMKN